MEIDNVKQWCDDMYRVKVVMVNVTKPNLEPLMNALRNEEAPTTDSPLLVALDCETLKNKLQPTNQPSIGGLAIGSAIGLATGLPTGLLVIGAVILIITVAVVCIK